MNPAKVRVALQRMAELALSKYPIEFKKIHWLGHSENVSFQIVTQAQTYLLRLHQPLVSFREDLWVHKTTIQSELLWLQALSRDTNLIVANPILNKNGEYVTQLQTGGEVINATLLSWIDGEHLQGKRNISQAKDLAILLAEMHNHSMRWNPPANFNRPKYDVNQLSKNWIEEIYSLAGSGLLNETNCKVIEETISRAKNEIIGTVPIKNGTWGMIHGDLHENNYLVTQGKLAPIDFSCCGYGYYSFDLATTLLHLDASVHKPFFEEYLHAADGSPEEGLQAIDAFMILAIARNFVFLSKNPQEYEYLTKAFGFYIDHYCTPYLKKQP